MLLIIQFTKHPTIRVVIIGADNIVITYFGGAQSPEVYTVDDDIIMPQHIIQVIRF